MAWGEDQVEVCKRMYFDGSSSAVIAAALGVTKNSVIGQVHRRGWNKEEGAPVRLPSMLGRGRPRTSTRQRNNTRQRNRKPKKMIIIPHFQAEDIVELPPQTASIPFFELQPDQCHWMPGEPTHDAPCCGALVYGTVDDPPYCATHYRRAYKV